jgi:iron(III) transport system permease protein
MKFVTPFVALIFASPIIYLIFAAFSGESAYFSSLIQNKLLGEYFWGSLEIGCLTTFFSLIIGGGTAWLISFHEFPLRRLFAWLLIMPLATPSYIAAMLYAHLLESAGELQQFIRFHLELKFGEYYFPNIRSKEGVIFILTFTLYPYIYMLMRAAFLMQSVHILESAAMLGCNRRNLFWRISLPLARPAMIAGCTLVMMEALVDFGVSSLYGITTLNTGIYRAWQSMMDSAASARLALMLSVIIIILLIIERKQRGLARFINYGALYHPIKRFETKRFHQIIFCVLCAIPILIGFVIPLVSLLNWSFYNISQIFNPYNLSAAISSLQIASIVAIFTTIIGILTAYNLRGNASKLQHIIINFTTSAYGFSGSIIAISVLLIVIMLQNNLAQNNFPWLQQLLFGGFIAIIWGCSLRFLTISHQTMQSGLERISYELDETSTMLGCNKWQRLKRVNLPLLKGSIIVSTLLVFIDTLKELPATILLRPFNVTPLSVRIYELAKDEMLSAAAPLALILLLISSIAVLYVNKELIKLRS